MSGSIWSQFWSYWSPKNYHFDNLSRSDFLFFGKFWHFQAWIFSKSQISYSSQLSKRQVFTFWNQPKLISRKIRVVGKIAKFPHCVFYLGHLVLILTWNQWIQWQSNHDQDSHLTRPMVLLEQVLFQHWRVHQQQQCLLQRQGLQQQFYVIWEPSQRLLIQVQDKCSFRNLLVNWVWNI